MALRSTSNLLFVDEGFQHRTQKLLLATDTIARIHFPSSLPWLTVQRLEIYRLLSCKSERWNQLFEVKSCVYLTERIGGSQ